MEDLQNRYWPSVDDLMTWMDTHPDAMIFLGLLFGVGFIVLFVGWWVGVMYVPPHARQTLSLLPQDPMPQDPIQPTAQPRVHISQQPLQIDPDVPEAADRTPVSVPRVDDRVVRVSPAPETAVASSHAAHRLEQVTLVPPASVSADGATKPILQAPSAPTPDSRTTDIPAQTHTWPEQEQLVVKALESSRLQEPTLGDLEFGGDAPSAERDLLQEQALTVQRDDAESQWTMTDLGELSEMIQQATFEEQDATSPGGADFPAEPSPAEPRVADPIRPEAAEEALLPQSRPWRLSDINDLKALDARLGRAHALRDTPTGVTEARQGLSQAPEFVRQGYEPVTEVVEMIAPEPLFPKREVRPIPGTGHQSADSATPALSPALPVTPDGPATPVTLATPEIPAPFALPVTPDGSSIPVTPASLAKDPESEHLSDTSRFMDEEGPLQDSEAPDERSRFADFQLKLDVSAQDLAEVGLPLQSEALVAESALPVVPPIVSLSDLNAEQLLLVARYCQWRGDLDGVREAIAPILERDDVRLRRQALALLEGR